MSRKHELRDQRAGTVINVTSTKQEGRLGDALTVVTTKLKNDFGAQLRHDDRWHLADIVKMLRTKHEGVDFSYYFETSAMKPDGGILSLVDVTGIKYPILITEVKNQGTNDLRAQEGKAKQAKGNAIERLGKNVIGFRTACLHHAIFPFVCSGDGCDFAPTSSILDRVTTIAMFGELNKIRVHNEGATGLFNRGSFFFREARWTPPEMAEIMYKIARSSVLYYFSKYGEDIFEKTPSTL